MQSNDNTIILSMEHVNKTLGKIRRIEDLSLTCRSGKIYGLIGPNGAGKTTLLNLITGLYRPDSGTIRVTGFDPVRDYKKARKQFGLLPQDTALYPELSARQNLEFYGALYYLDFRTLPSRIGEILQLTGLANRADEPVRGFSGGMKRRLGIGLALLNNPKLLFFDEPTLGVDVQNSHKIWEYIHALKQENKTVILTTNVMSEADNLCDEIFIINHGKIVCSGTPDDLKDSIGSSTVQLQLRGGHHISPEEIEKTFGTFTRGINGEIILCAPNGERDLLAALQHAEGKYLIENISLKKPTLDDVFVYYTQNTGTQAKEA